MMELEGFQSIKAFSIIADRRFLGCKAVYCVELWISRLEGIVCLHLQDIRSSKPEDG
jgi:hypothetical protein